jgi:hypothetical protein
MSEDKIKELEDRIAELERMCVDPEKGDVQDRLLSLECDLDKFLIRSENIGQLLGMIRDTAQYVADKEGVALYTVADTTLRRMEA